MKETGISKRMDQAETRLPGTEDFRLQTARRISPGLKQTLEILWKKE